MQWAPLYLSTLNLSRFATAKVLPNLCSLSHSLFFSLSLSVYLFYKSFMLYTSWHITPNYFNTHSQRTKSYLYNFIVTTTPRKNHTNSIISCDIQISLVGFPLWFRTHSKFRNCARPLDRFNFQQPKYLTHADFLLLFMMLNPLLSLGLLFCTKFYTLDLSGFPPIIRLISSIPGENTRQKMVSICG